MHHASFAGCSEHPWHRRSPARRAAHGVIWGGTIVLAGVLFLLEHLGYLGAYQAWSFWPLLLVILGMEKLAMTPHRLFGAALVLSGGVLLVHSLALLPVSWGLVWPALLIVLGVLLAARVITKRRCIPRRPFPADLPPGSVIMGSKEDRIDSQQYEGGEVSTVMGSYLLDLSRAEMEGDRVTVTARAVMGAIEIRIPAHWRVEVKASPVLGAVENRTREPVDATKTLVVAADVVLGGIEIRN